MSKQLIDRRQAGFTLVELAVVMIIIGLLIGGVLKGQELIGNAQVTSAVAQVKSIDAATSTFRDMYSALPGDMLNPTGRLPDCASAPCSTAGDGNGRLDDTPGAAPTGEGLVFFVHLSAADLLTGIDPSGGDVWGGTMPESPIRGTGLQAGYAATAGDLGVDNTTGARSGLYLTLTGDPAAAPDAALSPNQAFRIDDKLDDGLPESGSARAGSDGTCTDNGGGSVIYNEALPDRSCFLSVRIQG